MRGFGFLVFVALTAFCWGLYGPVLHKGQVALGAEGQLSTLRSLICVGIAYFLIAVIFPFFALMRKPEAGAWTVSGFVWSFMAGAVGAIGALGIILAFKFNGKPVVVMPLVFGLAPVMNTLVTMLMNRTVRNAPFWFYLGVAIVALGAVGVLTFKPTFTHVVSAQPAASTATNGGAAQSAEENQSADDQPSKAAEQPEVAPEKGSDGTQNNSLIQMNPEPRFRITAVSQETASTPEESTWSWVVRNFKSMLCVLLTAVCWGCYGPVLHRGQMKMNGSRLRPFLCVGLAYFVIGVIAPYLLLNQFVEPGSWSSFWGIFWSLMGGAAGAIGALGIIYAFNSGGKPLQVMPLVFGGAPIINTFAETTSHALAGDSFTTIDPKFFLSLAIVIVGAVTVLLSAPKGHAPKPAADKAV